MILRPHERGLQESADNRCSLVVSAQRIEKLDMLIETRKRLLIACAKTIFTPHDRDEIGSSFLGQLQASVAPPAGNARMVAR